MTCHSIATTCYVKFSYEFALYKNFLNFLNIFMHKNYPNYSMSKKSHICPDFCRNILNFLLIVSTMYVCMYALSV